jgi:hypothetical protein
VHPVVFPVLKSISFWFLASFPVLKIGLGFLVWFSLTQGWNQQLTNWLVKSTVLTQQIE